MSRQVKTETASPKKKKPVRKRMLGVYGTFRAVFMEGRKGSPEVFEEVVKAYAALDESEQAYYADLARKANALKKTGVLRPFKKRCNRQQDSLIQRIDREYREQSTELCSAKAVWGSYFKCRFGLVFASRIPPMPN